MGTVMARTVLFDEIGAPEVLRIAEVELGEPGPDELLVRLDALGLNRAEALFRSGGYYYPADLPSSRIGYEGAGVVEAVGPDVDGFAAGDPVLVTAAGDMSRHGIHGDRTVIPASSVMHRPAGVDAITGAALWLTYSTAYGALVESGGMRPGDRVVITAASSSVGLAAIQMANHLGAIPIATTRTDAKREQLLAAGAVEVIVTEQQDLVERVHALTGGRGAELVFDSVAGPGLAQVARAVAPGGTLIVYGWLDPRPAPLPMNWGLKIIGYGNLEFTGDPQARRRTEHFLAAGLRAGTLTPLVDRTFDLTDIADAHRYLESNVQVGKVVVTVDHREGPVR